MKKDSFISESLLNKIVTASSILFFVLAVWLIGREIEKAGWHHMWHLIRSTPLSVILLLLSVTLADYFILSFYDEISLSYIDKKLPYGLVFKTAGTGFAVSNTVGHAYASGGAVRYLFYTPHGLSKTDILKMITFEALTFLFGMGIAFAVGLVCAFFRGTLTGDSFRFLFYGSGIVSVLLFWFYADLVVRPHRVFRLHGTEIKSPSVKMTFFQFLIGFADNLCVALAFYMILSYHLPKAAFTDVFIVFIIAQTVGVATQVPGGMGVFESLFLLLYPHATEEKGALLASLMVFRVGYYFLPFLLAVFYLIYYFAKQKICLSPIKET